MLSSVPGFWWTNYTTAHEALSQDQHQIWCPYGMGGVLGEPFFLNLTLTDTGSQQYCRIINVAASQDHIVWIRNNNHGFYVFYNSKTTDLLYLHGWIVEKMNIHDTWKHSWGFTVTMSEWIRCYRSKVNVVCAASSERGWLWRANLSKKVEKWFS